MFIVATAAIVVISISRAVRIASTFVAKIAAAISVIVVRMMLLIPTVIFSVVLVVLAKGRIPRVLVRWSVVVWHTALVVAGGLLWVGVVLRWYVEARFLVLGQWAWWVV
jgi:hypothetical protein